MKLTELLQDITPLPWRKMPVLAEVLVSRETLANEAYALHAASVLPELVAAAGNLQQNWGRNLTGPMTRLNEALARAEAVARKGEPETE